MAATDATPLLRWELRSEVLSIAISHDGNRVASGSYDKLIRIWDVHTGSLVLGPLRGHTDSVESVAWSHDDTRLVSGSGDKTLRMWDAHTGISAGDPFSGHSEQVHSVAFSHDSTRIVSGSSDKTIRIWDARTGASIDKPLRRHGSSVLSVAFSHDSSYIISGSLNGTILIWDARTGAPIGKSLRGHTGPVFSVALSPDNTRIASAGSHEKTISLWDARTSASIGEPLRGHTGVVYSVAFSSDGTRIVSGSGDHTIRIWDACTGALIGEPLRGHTGEVHSVAFSSRNDLIVSGSGDGSICVWNTPEIKPSLNTATGPSFDIVTSKMSIEQMFDCLVKHGCTDYTSFTTLGRRSTAVIASGGFGDVRRVQLNDDTCVAIKTLRLHVLLKDDDKGVKRAVREVYMWSKLRHANVQELLGIVVFQGALGMVSPWMEHGNLQQYISANPNVERYPLCIQMTSGVTYLHGIDMVHGDLKATNVLVSQDGTLKINDFDYAILSNGSLQFSATTRQGGGTLRWMAPELFQAEDEHDEARSSEGEDQPRYTRTKQTDVYALGMTMLEIFTGTVPYSEYRTDVGIYRAIDRKNPPRRPPILTGPSPRATPMWELLLKCWSYDPTTRPDAPSVLAWLESFDV